MIARYYFLLACLLLAGYLTGCRASQHPVDQRPNAGIAPAPVELQMPQSDSTKVAIKLKDDESGRKETTSMPRKGLFSFLNARKPTKETHVNATQMPRKCKGCQITYVVGNDNKVSQAAIGKNKAAAVLASDSATQQVATNAVAGHHNTATQTAPAAPASGGLFARIGHFFANAGKALLLGLGLLLVLAIVFRKRLVPGFPF